MWTPGSVFRDSIHHIAVSVERATATGYVVTIDTAAATQVSTQQDVAIQPPVVRFFDVAAEQAAAERGLNIPREAQVAAATDSLGITIAVWQQAQPMPYGSRLGRLFAAYRDAGGQWSEGQPIDNPPGSYGLGNPDLAVDGQGNAYAVWQDTRDAHSYIYLASGRAGREWSNSIRLDGGDDGVQRINPTVAANRRGDVYAAWIEYRDHPGFIYDAHQGIIYGAYRPAGGAWEPAERVGAAIVRTDRPAVTVDEAGNAYVLWQDHANCNGNANNIRDVYYASRPAVPDTGETGTGWSTPIRIERPLLDDVHQPELAFDEVGKVYVVWWDAGEQTPRFQAITR
jgi:hypothetical protein